MAKFPLLPILFLFYNTDLVNESSNVAISLSVNIFINNITFYAVSSSIEKNYKLLTLMYDKCLNWVQTHRAVFILFKYQLIHFLQKKSISKSAIINLGFQEIVSPKNTTKLLDIILKLQLI